MSLILILKYSYFILLATPYIIYNIVLMISFWHFHVTSPILRSSVTKSLALVIFVWDMKDGKQIEGQRGP